MKISKTLYVTNRDDWRAWLRKNHETEKEIWLIYYKKHANQPRIPYDDAVEEALCFGWIDSIVQKIDNERYAQKFTPRKNNSKWSELNKRRIRNLLKAGKMTRAGLAKISHGVLGAKEGSKSESKTKGLVIPERDVSQENLDGARQVGYQPDDRVSLNRVLDKIERLQVETIAPMHGPVLTAHFEELIRCFREGSVASVSDKSALLQN